MDIKGIHIKNGIIIALTFLLCSNAMAYRQYLTPPNHPRNNSFYVCYHHRLGVQHTNRILYNYTRYRYVGCVISRKECRYQKKSCLYFGWFPTYHQARNAFYRCAYSG